MNQPSVCEDERQSTSTATPVAVHLEHLNTVGSPASFSCCTTWKGLLQFATRIAYCAGPAASPIICHRQRLVRAAAASDGSSQLSIHDGRLPLLDRLQQFVVPKAYMNKVLAGNNFAWGKIGLPGKDGLFIADLEAARSIMASELQLGVAGDWPETMRGMIGHTSISMTNDLDLHARLRTFMGMAFTKEAVQQYLPQLQQTTAEHMARWAAATAGPASGSTAAATGDPAQHVPLQTTEDDSMVFGYPAVRQLTFDVLVNGVLGLAMSPQEVRAFEQLFTQIVDGFVPPAWDLPFTAYGKGLKARQQLSARILETLASPRCTGVLARLRDEFGGDSPAAVNNTVTLLFAGFDTTSSSLTYMLWLLAQHPEVLAKVQAEQAEVVEAFGPVLTAEAYRAMPYTLAVVKETLRSAQVIAYVPRMATKELAVPGGPTLAAGCPFLVALAAISSSDPALQQPGDAAQFRPERWLDPAAAKTLSQYQLPFGTGQRTCLGINLAYAEMTAVLAELARSYELTADYQTGFKDFPIKRPDNGLPLRLTPRAAAAGPGAGAAAQPATLAA